MTNQLRCRRGFTTYVIATGVMSLSVWTCVGCRQSEPATVDPAETLSGTWVYKKTLKDQGSRNVTITFLNDHRMAWDIVLSRPPNEFRAYAEFELEPLGEGQRRVRMTSRREGGSLGEEIIRPEDKAPEVWRFEREGDSSLKITRPKDGAMETTVFSKGEPDGESQRGKSGGS